MTSKNCPSRKAKRNSSYAGYRAKKKKKKLVKQMCPEMMQDGMNARPQLRKSRRHKGKNAVNGHGQRR